MGLFRTPYVDPHEDAANLADGALAQFHDAHQDLLDANDILNGAIANDEALMADLETRVSKAKASANRNAVVADKLAQLLSL